ncbi:MAG: hypothetical protein IT185_02935 [Acidobacteria bacterium]|jgi:hypothetical protein|nr:hypothetical protein [Acidobacteriota bacterium]
MRRVSTFVCTVLTLAAAAACSSSPTAPVNSTFTLAPGQSNTVGVVTVKLVGVTEDTRCPLNALCIQVGDAHVALEVSAPGTRREVELQLLNPTNRATQVRGYTVEVADVTPYPYTVVPTQPGDYRVTLRVHRD